jgi:hypothetical protein
VTYITDKEWMVEVQRGKVGDATGINKIGEARDCDNGVDTDIWDGADGTTSSDVWAAPTTARRHDIKSTSVNDTSAGSGARTVRVWGLTDWASVETNEDVVLNGTSNVATANPYVIIHQMRCLTFGSGRTNAGIITATAQTDLTVTAAIQTGLGQTLMAIYGVPSGKKALVTASYGTVLRAVASPSVEITMFVQHDADQLNAGFVVKERGHMTADKPWSRDYRLPQSWDGPLIVKMQVKSNQNNTSCTAGFDLLLADIGTVVTP